MTDTKPVAATIIVADYASADSNGKINIIGGGVTLVGIQPGGMSAAFSVFVRLTSPMPIDDPVAIEVLLADSAGHVIDPPAAAGEASQPIRIAQNVSFERPVVPGVTIPRGAIASSAQMVINFPVGLPLSAGESYTWRVQIDHDVIASESFYIPAVSPIVLG